MAVMQQMEGYIYGRDVRWERSEYGQMGGKRSFVELQDALCNWFEGGFEMKIFYEDAMDVACQR